MDSGTFSGVLLVTLCLQAQLCCMGCVGPIIWQISVVFFAEMVLKEILLCLKFILAVQTCIFCLKTRFKTDKSPLTTRRKEEQAASPTA
jgi:hypothetical protein